LAEDNKEATSEVKSVDIIEGRDPFIPKLDATGADDKLSDTLTREQLLKLDTEMGEDLDPDAITFNELDLESLNTEMC